MRLFQYTKHTLVLNTPEILLVPEFKAIMDMDKSEDKKTAFKLFAYAYLMIDWSSPYREFSEGDRQKEALKDTGLSFDYIGKTEEVQKMLRKYQQIRDSNIIVSMAVSIINSTHKFKDQYLDALDFTAIIEKGARAGTRRDDPSDYINNVKKTKDMFNAVRDLMKDVEEEMEKEKGKTFGSRRKGIFNEGV